MKKIVITSGYFNPLHIGHINLIKEAKTLGDYLVVIVNNDKQIKIKGSVHFMPEQERIEISQLKNKFIDIASFIKNPPKNAQHDESLYEISDKITVLREYIDTYNVELSNGIQNNLEIVLDKFKDVEENTEAVFDRIAGLVVASKKINEGLDDRLKGYLISATNKMSDNLFTNIQVQFKTLEALLSNSLESNDTSILINESFNRLKQEFHTILNDNDSVIMNMSSKMNKLILASEQNSAYLKTNLAHFKNAIQEIRDHGLSSERENNNSQVIRNSLIKLAEWVDGAGYLIEETNAGVKDLSTKGINSKILLELNELKEGVAYLNSRNDETSLSDEMSKITSSLSVFEKKLKKDLADIDNNISDKLEDTLLSLKKEVGIELKKINSKFERFEAQFDNLQSKVELIETKGQTIGEDVEIKHILEFIANQVSASNESGKGQAAILKKLEAMDKKINTFIKNSDNQQEV